MDYKISLIKYLYYFSLIGLLVLYFFPGSILGYFFYKDFSQQPDLFPNPLGISINHLLAFSYLSLICLIRSGNNISFNRNVFFLIALSILTELSHIIIPQRSFEYFDLFANLLGTSIAIIVVFFYKRRRYGKV
tara:strand:- start:30 stop:428 length:399 start_codon:yes stop_codon:yes gene_type:complete